MARRHSVCRDVVLTGVVRLATNKRIYKTPSLIGEALGFCEGIVQSPNCIIVRPGPRHWRTFAELCRRIGASGNLISDAFLAALALEHDCQWITFDQDFDRFPGLTWRSPLETHAHTNPL